MSTSIIKLAFIWTTLCIQLVLSQSRHNQYASILQDTRNEPTPDGHFGYLYKTEDGITSSASGDPSGVIHGTFSYTDPTGLKVNYNYNAGSRFTPGYNYNKGRPSAGAPGPAPVPAPAVSARLPAPATAPKYYKNPAPASPRYREPVPEYQEEPEYYREPPQEQYVEPAPRYRSRSQPVYRDSADVYQERRNRPPPRGGNDLDDVNYRG